MHPYETIRSEILRRINDQTWPAGYVLPQEEQLAVEFEVARGTVRRALSSLVDAGLIERKRRAGTRVVDRKSHTSTLTIPIVRHEIENAGHHYGYKLLSARICGPEIDEKGIFGDVMLRHILCLHLNDGRPYQLEDRIISIDAIPEAETFDFKSISPNEWLIAKAPYSSVRTILRADCASGNDMKHLRVKAHDPVFIIDRQTSFNKVPLTYARLSHSGDRYQIVTETDEI
ncbi:GntR family transcriptional regulator [Kordiimonas sp. SCSIO 12610]|uniref:GntR family transcriptional regulator n=1 Tax=Kordiimonas sp. SCSIO 12610 TaxID=2829597 RepID=UPI00210AA87F|nr:GntR family transcriptional regulator [Kordiimonas sp. SCSIO 12610]